MTTKEKLPQCAERGCKDFQAPGSFMNRCLKHRREPLTVPQQITVAPVFARRAQKVDCAACNAEDVVDTLTGLCRPCWRSWRWSPIRERPMP